MKKIFMSMMGLAVALGFGTSCSDEKIEPASVGDAQVTFTISMEGESGSRAYSDGTTAKQLIFAVYEANGKELTALRQGDRGEIKFDENLKATVTTQLVKGKSYDFVFWAQPDGGTAFDVSDMRHIKVNYNEATLKCNNELLDAFYYSENDVKVTGSVNMDVTLRRPFAQVNFGTSKADWEAAVKAGVGDVVTTKLTFDSGIYSTLNTRDGSVSDLIDALVFDFTNIPVRENEWLPNVDALKKNDAGEMEAGTDGVYEDYRWLAMTYVLVNTREMSNKVTMALQSATVDTEVPVSNVPLQRNYRTNIVGDLLTTGAVFNVVIDPIYYKPDNNIVVPTVVKSYAALLEALADPNVPVVGLGEDITLPTSLSITRDVTIDGMGKTLTYTGSARAIDIPAEANGADVTIKDINIDFSSSYTQRGINYNTSGTLTLEDVTLTGEHVTYGVNLPAKSDNSTVVINDSEITALIPLNIWGEKAEITVNNTILTSVDHSTLENYAAIVLNSDGTEAADETVVTVNGGKVIAKDENGNPSIAVRTATGTVIISDATEVVGSGFTTVAIVSYGTDFYAFSTLQSAVNKAIKDNKEVKLVGDVELAEGVVVNGNVTIDLNGKTIANNSKEGSDYVALSAVVVEGGNTLTLKDSSAAGTGAVKSAAQTAVWARGGNAVIESGNYFGAENAVYASARDNNAGTVVINDGRFESSMNDGIYTLNLHDASGKAGTASITVYGGVYVNFDPANNKAENPAVSFVAAGYKSVDMNDGTYKVVKE